MVLFGVCLNFCAGGPPEHHLHRVKVALYFWWEKEEKRKESVAMLLCKKKMQLYSCILVGNHLWWVCPGVLQGYMVQYLTVTALTEDLVWG